MNVYTTLKLQGIIKELEAIVKVAPNGVSKGCTTAIHALQTILVYELED